MYGYYSRQPMELSPMFPLLRTQSLNSDPYDRSSSTPCRDYHQIRVRQWTTKGTAILSIVQRHGQLLLLRQTARLLMLRKQLSESIQHIKIYYYNCCKIATQAFKGNCSNEQSRWNIWRTWNEDQSEENKGDEDKQEECPKWTLVAITIFQKTSFVQFILPPCLHDNDGLSQINVHIDEDIQVHSMRYSRTDTRPSTNKGEHV